MENSSWKLAKTLHVNLSAFSMITRKDKSKTLTKHIPLEYKCKCDSRTCNSNQKWNNNICQSVTIYICEKSSEPKKIYWEFKNM